MSLHRVPVRRVWSGIAMLAMSAGGCFDPTFRDPICGPGGECPAGWSCANGENQVCVPGTPLPGEPDAMPAACDEDRREWIPVLANGNFEAGAQDWVTAPASFDPIRMEGDGLPVTTDDGTWAALLGEADNVDQVMSQVVTIPSGTTRVRLTGQRCFATNETDATMEFDKLFARLSPANDPTTTLVDIVKWTNGDGAASCGWTTFDEAVDAAGLPTMAQLRLVSDLDMGNITTFYLDALSLETWACPPALAAGTER